jgi:hypothetical protein
MFQNRAFLLVSVAALVAPAVAHADGSAPLRFRNSSGSPVYFCVDDGGRGAPNNKAMQDGRPGTLLAPGACVRVPDTNLFDRPTLRIYNADGVEIYSKTLALLPIGGERWEQDWNGSKLDPDNR